MRGWHKENFRHSLAARGIKTYYSRKYLAELETPVNVAEPAVSTKESVKQGKSAWERALQQVLAPQTGLGRAKAAVREQQFIEATIRSQRPIDTIISDISTKGTYVSALHILNPQFDAKADQTYIEDIDGSITGTKGTRILVTEADQEAVKTALSERALTLVNARMPVPADISKNLNKDFVEHLKTIREAKRREDETPFRKVLREQLQKGGIAAAGGAAEALPEGLGWAKEGYESLGTEQQFPGVAQQFGRLSESPLKKNSVLAGHEEDGLMNPLRWMDEGVPQLDQSYAYLGKVDNPVLSRGAPQAAIASKRVSEQVDSLYNARGELAETDLKKYDEGMEAFKKGDREKLIKSISELEAEENKLKDRWTIIGATHRGVLSAENQQAVFHKSSDNPVLDMQSSGARKIADQTEKLARVRADLLKSMNQTYTRRALLQNALTRMNANIPPDKGAPRDIKRLGKSSGFWMAEIPNPVVSLFKEKNDARSQ